MLKFVPLVFEHPVYYEKRIAITSRLATYVNCGIDKDAVYFIVLSCTEHQYVVHLTEIDRTFVRQ